jgi:hypothetical protein
MDVNESDLRVLYAYSEHLDANVHNINYVVLDLESGNKKKEVTLPNEEKLTLVKDYTIWYKDKIVIVGKKGLLGKKSALAKYNL